ncbi:inosine/xanthosine triphosphatase [Vibrio spartinae]|uniref:inosine/xanthosine triphosphatase n=1 Tax=Vibrio spartinae TaxID=1918945 RepID=A0A1N6M247_9VIBR|nr:inosine/xanthosine triphosphatase [Vibrio spartinae]SIO93471.1 Non-canonical purine NTP phosphatase [Vibrio spartinae]
MQNNINVLVLSKNIAKNESVKQVFSSIFKDKEIIFHSVEVKSDISKTPINDEEAILGIENRIKNCKTSLNDIEKDYDYLVSMEGLINHYSFGHFVYGWVKIEDLKKSRNAYGCSAKVKIPETIVKRINKDQELSDVIKEMYSEIPQDKINTIGTNGVITNEAFTRVDEFNTALLTSLGYLINEKNHDY